MYSIICSTLQTYEKGHEQNTHSRVKQNCAPLFTMNSNVLDQMSQGATGYNLNDVFLSFYCFLQLCLSAYNLHITLRNY